MQKQLQCRDLGEGKKRLGRSHSHLRPVHSLLASRLFPLKTHFHSDPIFVLIFTRPPTCIFLIKTFV